MNEKGITRVTLDISKRTTLKGKTDWARLRSMTDAEVHAAAVADKDNPPLTTGQLARLEPIPNVRSIREGLGLSQPGFAKRFRLSLATIRDWEQGRYQPDQAARTLLRLIAREPVLVERALKT